ncbi:MAG: DUF898 family protein [Alphaproteobacteria bacterium]|nr:DUF898 family protein [Alphaproteobacteria bacterium]
MITPALSARAALDLDKIDYGGDKPQQEGRREIASRLAYDRSRDDTLIGMHIVNVILIVVTATLYRFWAVTRVRRLVWSKTRFDGEPFEYTGNGLEIFLGFLKVFAVVLLPIGVLAAVVDASIGIPTTMEELATQELYAGAQVVVILSLLEMGRFLSWRYRLSRTRWRGIRGRIDASVWRYAGVALLTVAAWLFTGTLLKPVADAMRAKFVLSRMSLGTQKVQYFGGDVILFGRWFMVAFLSGVVVAIIATAAIPSEDVMESVMAADDINAGEAIVGRLVIALVIAYVLIMWLYFWYRAGFWRYVAEHTRLGGLSFRFHASGTQMFGLWLGNMLILVFSVGLLAPLTWRRRIEFLARHLEVLGALDPAMIRQAAEDDGALGGEGLVGDFDIA